ncbi:MAG: hypothetical protein JWM11_3851 [Planctomycetaceae bacterium]|nr:hypothetical protein [Planctomycetaceae bacterium]
MARMQHSFGFLPAWPPSRRSVAVIDTDPILGTRVILSEVPDPGWNADQSNLAATENPNGSLSDFCSSYLF